MRLYLLLSAMIAPFAFGNKPNILFIMVDQGRWDLYGTYGNTASTTPNIDALATNGIRFDKAYSTSTICIPARATLLTGMKPWNTGLLA